ncbi:hypothetical protein GW17_00038376 [Ensete ventricosum]|nr:hypothetical protein GW17_00038376 [Ensete ventricosum]
MPGRRTRRKRIDDLGGASGLRALLVTKRRSETSGVTFRCTSDTSPTPVSLTQLTGLPGVLGGAHVDPCEAPNSTARMREDKVEYDLGRNQFRTRHSLPSMAKLYA